MAASNIPGISTEDVVVHAPGGKMQLGIDWDDDRPATATVVYRCPWASAVPLAKELRGGFPSGGSSGLIAPAAPHAFPLIPELYCSGVSIRPKDDEARKGDISGEDGFPFNYHVHALVTAKYRSPDWAFDAAQAAEYPGSQIDPGNPIVGCRQRVRASTAFLTLEGAKIILQSSLKVVESTDGLPANQVEFVLEYPRLRVDPTLFLAQFKGKVNNATLFGLPAEHVLFDSFDVERVLSLGGIEVSASLTLLGQVDLSWNERLNDEGVAETAIFISSDPAKVPFASANLHGMLGIPNPGS